MLPNKIYEPAFIFIIVSIVLIISQMVYKNGYHIASVAQIFQFHKEPIEISVNINTLQEKTLKIDQPKCELYNELKYPMKVNTNNIDTTQEFQDIIKNVNRIMQSANKVRAKQQLLKKIKITQIKVKPIDFYKINKLYANVIKQQQNIQLKNQQLKILLKLNSNSKTWEISVQQKYLEYLNRRKQYYKNIRLPNHHNTIVSNIQTIHTNLQNYQSLLKQAFLKKEEMTNYKIYQGQLKRLDNQVQYYRLKLEQIGKCSISQEGRKEQKSHPQIFAQLQRLKKLQSEFHDRKYCMDLTQHLLKKLRKQFKFLQSTFKCVKQQEKVQKELQQTQQRLRQKINQKSNFESAIMQMQGKLVNQQKNHANNSNTLKNLIQSLDVKISQDILQYLISQIDGLIQKHKDILNSLKNQKKQTAPNPSATLKLIRDINILKLQFCQSFNEYTQILNEAKEEVKDLEQQRNNQKRKVHEYEKLKQQILSEVQFIQLLRKNIEKKTI